MIYDLARTVYDAKQMYDSGDVEGAVKLVSGNVSSWLAGCAATTYLEGANVYIAMTIGAACPIAGVGAFILLTLIEFTGASILAELANDAIYALFDLFRDALAQRIDPLVLDLDRNGVAEKMGWVVADDGLLVYDANKNGKIDNGNELYGNATSMQNGEIASNGFLALADNDTNGDGVIDEKDSIYKELKIWNDKNEDGVTDNGERMSLEQAGVKSIHLDYIEEKYMDEQNNEHNQISTYIKSDGTEADIHDIWFEMDSVDTEMLSESDEDYLEESDDIILLPNLTGTGQVNTLHQAMMHDDSGKLKKLVENFMEETDTDKRKNIVSQILYQWTGVYNSNPYSRGVNIKDARRLEVLEKFLGQKYWSSTYGENPIPAAGEILERAYANLVDMYYYQLVYQTDYKELNENLELKFDAEEERIGLNFTSVAEKLVEEIKNNEDQGTKLFSDYIDILYRTKRVNSVNFDEFKSTLNKLDEEYGMMFQYGGNDIIDGMDSDDKSLKGYGGDDVIYAYHGDDTLYGGEGNDVWQAEKTGAGI